MIGKEQLLEAFQPTSEVELPSGRGAVKVRGLTRWEATNVTEGVDQDDNSASTQLLLERRAVALGMVEPKLTEEEVGTWQEASVAADVLAVAQAISKMSALDKEAGKGPTSRSKRGRT